MPEPEPEQQRQRIIYQGRVQGVGFRYTVRSIATRYPVVGYVKNLPNRTVELVAEGAPAVLQSFLQEIAEAFAGNISDVQIDDAAVDEQFQRFEIRR